MGVPVAERFMSATEARVHFGELLDSIAKTGEAVIVERSGQPVAAVIPIDDWRTQRSRLDDRWAKAGLAMEEYWAFLRTQRAAEPIDPVDAAEIIRSGREERDAQILSAVLGREPGDPLPAG
jgi:prevent-host-death family protein